MARRSLEKQRSVCYGNAVDAVATTILGGDYNLHVLTSSPFSKLFHKLTTVPVKVGEVWRVASENVVAELLKIKCFPILLYSLEACPLITTQI